MIEPEQRKRVRIVAFAGALVSLTLTVWVVYAFRTGRFLILAQYAWLWLLLGFLLVSAGAFIGAQAIRSQNAPGEMWASLTLRAVSSTLFGLAALLHIAGVDAFWLARLAVVLAAASILVSFFSVAHSWREWREKRDRAG